MMPRVFLALPQLFMAIIVGGRYLVQGRAPVRPGADRISYRIAAYSLLLTGVSYAMPWRTVSNVLSLVSGLAFLAHVAIANWIVVKPKYDEMRSNLEHGAG